MTGAIKKLIIRSLGSSKPKGLEVSMARSGAVQFNVEGFLTSRQGKKQLKRVDEISRKLKLEDPIGI